MWIWIAKREKCPETQPKSIAISQNFTFYFLMLFTETKKSGDRITSRTEVKMKMKTSWKESLLSLNWIKIRKEISHSRLSFNRKKNHEIAMKIFSFLFRSIEQIYIFYMLKITFACVWGKIKKWEKHESEGKSSSSWVFLFLETGRGRWL